MSPFCGALIHLFWTSGDVSTEFQNQSGQPYLSCAEAYVLHVPWDSPLLRHLLTSWWPAWQLSCLFHIPARHWWDSKLGAIMLLLTVWDQADALPTELSQFGLILPIFGYKTLKMISFQLTFVHRRFFFRFFHYIPFWEFFIRQHKAHPRIEFLNDK